MRVLVTGATGFVGWHLCRGFLEAGHQVVGMVRRESEELSSIGVQQVLAELEKPASLREAIRKAGVVDTLIHNAGLTRARGLEEYWQVNAIGTFNLMQALRETSMEPGQLIYIGSLAAAGPGRLVDEEREPHPLTPYGASKLYGERFVESSGIPCLILRPPVIYGPRDRALLTFFKMVKLGVVPRWERHYSLCFVRDLSAACVAAAENRIVNRTVFVAQGEFTFAEMVEKAGSLLGKQPRAIPLPETLISLAGACGGIARCLFRKAPLISPEKAREMREPAWSCSTKLYQELELPEPTSLEDGFRETVEWYREEGWLH